MSTNPATTTKTRLTILNTREGWELHAPGCADIKRTMAKDMMARSDGGFTFGLEGTTEAEIARNAAIWLNEDFAADHDMTPEEYVDAGEGYTVRVLPCACKAAKANTPAPVEEPEVEDEDETPEPGTPAAAAAELARRAHNRMVKKTGEGVRQEAASDWAFEASAEELKALVG